MRLVAEPDACHEFLEKSVDAALAQLRQLHDAVGPYCDMLMIAHDIGDSIGVTIGPDLWREIYKPHYRRLFSGWHKITDMKISLHSCGAIFDVIGDLIECGLDVLNPVQISANGMEPERLKATFGTRIIFYGGAYDAIKHGQLDTEEEVYEAVRENIRILSRGGGYLFAGVHNLPGDISEAHLRAILGAWRDVRGDRGTTPNRASPCQAEPDVPLPLVGEGGDS